MEREGKRSGRGEERSAGGCCGRRLLRGLAAMPVLLRPEASSLPHTSLLCLENTTPAAAMAQAARAAALAAWLKERGATFDALAWPVTFPSGRSVAAARRVKRREVLARIPTAIVLTPDRARARLAWLFSATPAMAAHEDNDVLALTLLLLEAAACGPTHDFYTYVCCLPDLATYASMPCEWSEEELALLQDGDMAHEARAVKAAVAQEYSDVAGALAAIVAGSASAGAPSAPHAATASLMSALLSWSTFRWARHNVTSRIYIYGLGMDELFICEGTKDMLPVAMVPLGDMVNHDAREGGRGLLNSSSSGGVCDAEWVKDTSAPPLTWKHDGGQGEGGEDKEDEDRGWYVLKAERRYEAGSEVCISYGDRPGRDLLETYGFIPPHEENAAEAAAVRVDGAGAGVISRVAGPAVVSLRQRLLEGVCPDPSSPPPLELPPLSVPVTEGGGDAGGDGNDDPFAQPPPEAMLMLRVLVLADEDIAAEASRLGCSSDLSSSAAGTASVPAPVLKELLKDERLLSPLNKTNEVAALKLLQALIAAEVDAGRTVTSPLSLLLAGGSSSFASLSLAAQVSSLEAALNNELALRSYLSALLQQATPPPLPDAPDAPLPWLAPAPGGVTGRSWMGGDAATAAARRLAACTYRCGRVAVFLSHLRYVARMLKLAGAAGEGESGTCGAHSPLPALAGLTSPPSVCLEIQVPWAQLLLSGVKSIETRSYPLPPQLLGVPIGVLESPAGGGLAAHGLNAGNLLGIVVFRECKGYTTREAWAADCGQHCVPVSATPAEHGWVEPVVPGEATKWGWVVSAALLFDAPQPVSLTEDARVLRSLFRL